MVRFRLPKTLLPYHKCHIYLNKCHICLIKEYICHIKFYNNVHFCLINMVLLPI